jgi:large subunit ribosomal protein L10
MDRAIKPKVVDSLKATFTESSMVVITNQTGLTVDESNALRATLRNAGGSFRIAKNTLARIAVKGTESECLIDHLKGTTGIASGSDPVAVAKAVTTYANQNDKFHVVAASLNGRVLNAASIKQLSTLPPLDNMRAMLIGLILAPATKIAGVCQAPAAQLARVFGAYAAKDN